MDNRNLYLDYIKGILIFLVILGHTIQFAYMHGPLPDGYWTDNLWKLIYIFHMPLFIGISGYFSYFSLKRGQSVYKFIYFRIVYLLIPLITWCIIESFIFIYFSSNITIYDYIKWITIRIIMSHWFIWSILLASILIAIASQVKWSLYLLIISLIIVISIPSSFNYFNFGVFKSVYSYFILGFLFAEKDMTRFYTSNRNGIFLIALLILVFGYFLWDKETFIYNTPSTWGNIVTMLCRFTISVSCSIVFLSCFYYLYNKFSSYKITKLVINWGRESLSLYLIQSAFFLILEYWVFNFYTKWSFLLIIPSFIISVIFLLITQLIEKNSILALCLLGKKTFKMKKSV